MVKGVILRLDTPGGEVTASDIIYHEILNFKKRTEIPVMALMMGLTASADIISLRPATTSWLILPPLQEASVSSLFFRIWKGFSTKSGSKFRS